MNKVKRLLALVLCLCMVLTLLPMGTLAAEQQSHKTDLKVNVSSDSKAGTTDVILSDEEEHVELGAHVNSVAATYVSEREAGKQLRKKMKQRVGYMEFYVRSNNFNYESAFFNLMTLCR